MYIYDGYSLQIFFHYFVFNLFFISFFYFFIYMNEKDIYILFIYFLFIENFSHRWSFHHISLWNIIFIFYEVQIIIIRYYSLLFLLFLLLNYGGGMIAKIHYIIHICLLTFTVFLIFLICILLLLLYRNIFYLFF